MCQSRASPTLVRAVPTGSRTSARMVCCGGHAEPVIPAGPTGPAFGRPDGRLRPGPLALPILRDAPHAGRTVGGSLMYQRARDGLQPSARFSTRCQETAAITNAGPTAAKNNVVGAREGT